MAKNEEEYWWHKGRRQIIQVVAKNFFSGSKNNIADVGCGTGGNYSVLKNFGTVDGLDISKSALTYCQNRNVYHNLVCAAATEIPQQTYTIITAFDVLEHLDADEDVLKQWEIALKPGGYIFITVPAYLWLFGPHDISLHHKRRYTRTELLKKAREAGFTPIFSSYFFLFTFPLLCLSRLKQKLHKDTQNIKTYPAIPRALSFFLELLSTLEGFILKNKIPLPFGSSIILVARKK